MPQIISFTQKGDFKRTNNFLRRIVERRYVSKLRFYGEKGVRALSNATPVDTGKTSESWVYGITEDPGRITVFWRNTNVEDGVNIALILQYGHATRNGGWVEGLDYINPAIRSIFNDMADAAWREVISS